MTTDLMGTIEKGAMEDSEEEEQGASQLWDSQPEGADEGPLQLSIDGRREVRRGIDALENLIPRLVFGDLGVERESGLKPLELTWEEELDFVAGIPEEEGPTVVAGILLLAFELRRMLATFEERNSEMFEDPDESDERGILFSHSDMRFGYEFCRAMTRQIGREFSALDRLDVCTYLFRRDALDLADRMIYWTWEKEAYRPDPEEEEPESS